MQYSTRGRWRAPSISPISSPEGPVEPGPLPAIPARARLTPRAESLRLAFSPAGSPAANRRCSHTERYVSHCLHKGHAPALLYLAYGSNLLPERLRARVPSAHLSGIVRLRGWSLRFHKHGQDGSAKCDLLHTASAGDVAHGAVYEIAAEERVQLDKAEGLGCGYDLAWLDLEAFGRVFLYRAAQTHVDERLKPFSWYRDLVEAGARFHRFPAAYVARIREVEALEDPDRERHGRNLALLQASPE